MKVLGVGSVGASVKTLQKRLRELGFNPGKIDGKFGSGTEAAVMAFQRSEGLLADGVVGPRTASALELKNKVSTVSVIPQVTVQLVSKMFPATPIDNLKTHLPPVLKALMDADLRDKKMVLMALATIRAETASFRPISEFQSRFNTSPGGRSFDLYDNRKDLGNKGPIDGELFKGRGFIQLTGRSNYVIHGKAIGLGKGLVEDPELGNDPEIASKLLASFLKAKEIAIKEALLDGDLRAARRLVNGGSHGLDQFSEAYRIGDALLPNDLAVGKV